MLQTPIAFLIFNRPDLTARVFETIRAQKPRQLLVVADGPRRENERELCEATRAVVETVDWPCEVLKNYSPTNLGCKKRVSSGLDWVFQNVEEAIILEDDCLPHPNFFAFCETMLARYREDKRIMNVSGDRFFPAEEEKHSHYFSRNVHIWGWATWSRAWAHYDVEMRSWENEREKVLALFSNPRERLFYAGMFDAVHSGQLDTWDFQWMMACFVQSGLSVIPPVNLISNLGFREDATHTQGQSSFAELATFELPALPHPPHVYPDLQRDKEVIEMFLGPLPSLLRRLQNRIWRAKAMRISKRV